MNALSYTALFLLIFLGAVGASYPVALFIRFLEVRMPRKNAKPLVYLAELLAFNAAASLASAAVLLRYPAFRDDPSLLLNSVISYVTGTNLQHFAGESVITYFGFLASLGVLQWVAPITGLSVAISLISSIADSRLGDFLVNLLTSTATFALLTAIFTLASVALGVPLNFGGLHTMGVRPGPIALINSQTLLGDNGGPYFSTGFYLPITNPSPASTLLYTVEMPLLPFALIWLLGIKLRRLRISGAMFFATGAALLTLAALSYAKIPGFPPQVGNPLSNAFMAASMATNTGASLVSLYSLTPFQQTLYIVLMAFGNIPGSVGTGFIELIFLILISLFFVGLMSGRLPYFLNRRLTTREVVAVSVALLVKAALMYAGALFAIVLAGATYHLSFGAAFTPMLWEVISAIANNGSDFYGALGNTPALNSLTSALMLSGRYVTLALGIYVAGLLMREGTRKAGEAVVDVSSIRFAVALIVFNFILNILSVFPLLALGPLAA